MAFDQDLIEMRLNTYSPPVSDEQRAMDRVHGLRGLVKSLEKRLANRVPGSMIAPHNRPRREKQLRDARAALRGDVT